MNCGRNQWLFLMIGGLSLAASQWLTLWLLARTASPETVGRCGLAMGWMLPACALAALQLRPLMATELRLGSGLPAYLDLRLIAMGSLSLVLVPLLFVEVPGVGSGALLGAIGVSRLVELASDFVDALRHRDRSYLDLGFSQCCRSLAGFTAFGLVWLSSQRLIHAIIAAAVVAFCSAILIDFPALRRYWSNRFKVSGKEQWQGSHSLTGTPTKRSILTLAAPLAVVQFLNLGVVVTPRLLLGIYSTLEAVASFTCLASALGVASLLSSAYTASLAPDLAEAFHDQSSSGMSIREDPHSRVRGSATDRAAHLLLRASRNVCLSALPLLGILAIGGDPLLRLLYGPGIEFPYWAIVLTALFATIWGIAAVFGTAATATRRIGLQLWAFSLALTSGAATGVLLIPALGVVGASASLLISAIVLLSTYLFAFRNLFASREGASHSLSKVPCGIVAD